MPVVYQVFYIGRDNVIDLLVEADNVPVDFSAVSSMELHLTEVDGDGTNDVVVQTPGSHAGVISWTADGWISIKPRNIVSVSGTYSSVLIAFDPTHPSGQVLAQERAASELVLLAEAV